MNKRLKIFEVKSEYIQYLSNYQNHLFLHTNEKGKRKYIGIVFQINGINFFAPLSSYKTKHVKMKESVDFIKIKDYAVINLNNMIPVPNSQIVEIVYSHKIHNGDSTALAKRINDFELLEKLCSEY